MSDDNEARLRQAIEVFNRGDFDAATEIFHPDVEVVSVGDQPPYRGRSEVREWMEPDAFSEQTWEPLDSVTSGSKVLLNTRVKARGAGSGIEMQIESWTVWTFDDDGLVIRLEAFLDHEKAEALEAAGLSE